MNKETKEIHDLVNIRNSLFDKETHEISEDHTESEIDDYAKQINGLLIKYIDKLTPDFVLETVTHLGCWPQLIYDDDGHWAVTEHGFSNVLGISETEEKEDYHQTSVVTEHNSWKDNIRDAVKYYIEHDEDGKKISN